MPAISIIIPVFKVEKYLRACLDSVIAQTFTDWEAICVDDGSPDNSGKILAEYAARDKRFKVFTQENMGLSVARNTGMKHARGDYVMYLDSDDFLHPQAMEVTYTLARRDNSDMVAFTYDRSYRPKMMIRHKLGLDTDNVVPKSIRRRYDAAKIKTRVTDDILKYATERTHNPFNLKRKWLVKHCQVWKNLYRREMIQDIAFIKGILFEDVPWWSALLLKQPRTTITRMPLVFYRPNFGGIVLSAKALHILQGLCIGINDAYMLYHKSANEYQTRCWTDNFKWFFIKKAFSKIKYIDNAHDLNAARECFVEMNKIGALDNPPFKWAAKVRAKIYDFIRPRNK